MTTKEAQGLPQDTLVSAQDPMTILAGIKQFGLAPDGSDLRDLEGAIRSLSEANAALEKKYDVLLQCYGGATHRRETAEAQIVAAWNAFAGHLADTAEEVYFQFDAADGDIAEQITALTKQRDTAEAALSAATAEIERLKGVMADEVTAAQTKSLDVSLDGNTRRGYALVATRLGAVLSTLFPAIAASKAEAAVTWGDSGPILGQHFGDEFDQHPAPEAEQRGNDLEGGDDA